MGDSPEIRDRCPHCDARLRREPALALRQEKVAVRRSLNRGCVGLEEKRQILPEPLVPVPENSTGVPPWLIVINVLEEECPR